MMSNKERPNEIKINHIYLTSISECWHRIKIVEMNDKEANAICIDNGDYEWISLEDIYVCKPEFLCVAPQAFKLSLFGLEDFENDPNVTQQSLFEPLIHKSLVAEIMMSKEFWTANKSKSVKMILYDTSTDEDVNMNEYLMNSILKSVTAPTLNQKESNQIVITNITDDGVYCQLVKSAAYIQKLINNVSKDDITQYRGFYADKMDKKKVYLIYDDKLKNWFRARLDKMMDGNSHSMYLIDHGCKTNVKSQNIYRLDKISYVLSLYPAQVIKFGLFNVNYNDDVKKRLLAMLPTGRQAFVSFHAFNLKSIIIL
jgi:tudor domain-containing protein 1/4/6/7